MVGLMLLSNSHRIGQSEMNFVLDDMLIGLIQHNWRLCDQELVSVTRI